MAESSRPLLSSWQIKQRFGVLEQVSLSPPPLPAIARLPLVIAFDDAKDTDMICSRVLWPGAATWWRTVSLEQNSSL